MFIPAEHKLKLTYLWVAQQNTEKIWNIKIMILSKQYQQKELHICGQIEKKMVDDETFVKNEF